MSAPDWRLLDAEAGSLMAEYRRREIIPTGMLFRATMLCARVLVAILARLQEMER